MKFYPVAIALFFMHYSCTIQNKKNGMIVDNETFQQFLEKDTALLPIVKNKEKYRLQIIYTQINRDKNNLASFKNFEFNVSDSYFYPASTVKFPVALLALQRINELKDKGIDEKTTINFGAAFSGQVEIASEPQAENGRPTIENYIKQILIASDNPSYNRLYEFLGQEYINRELRKKKNNQAQIRHRLEIFLSNEENAATNPIKFLDSDDNIIYSEPLKISNFTFENRHDFVGQSFYRNNELVKEPMDFSTKNKLPLSDLHSMVQNLVFPSDKSFKINKKQRNFLLKNMSKFPSESKFPNYGPENHDASAKFLFYGAEKGEKPKHIRIFNKIGDAYGQLTDAVYFIDFEENVEFLLSATIYCNEDEILNDNKYDYETIGFPFMKRLGEAVYKYERNRKKDNLPDLSEFEFDYSH